jgi:NDP-sugar pyrophosphorylase family protein
VKAVILAGGQGARLRPYTTVLPKQLMPVGNFPIAEILVRQLRQYGVEEITFAVGYLHQLIEAYFGDGSRWKVKIDYLLEDRPLGTAGPLACLKGFDEPLIVLNGDILTDLNFERFYQAHLESGSEITIASFAKKIDIDLGVIKTDDSARIVDYIEKPQYSFLASMGVYAFSPSVVNFIPEGQRLDFPDLVKAMIAAHRKVRAFRFEGIWLDVGRTEDYFSASEVFGQHQSRLLPAMAQPAVQQSPSVIDVTQ